MSNPLDPKSWEKVVVLNCGTEQETDIESYGDWELVLRRDDSNHPPLSLQVIVEMSVTGMFQQYVNKESYPEITNTRDGFEKLGIEVKCDDQQFKEMFGFWDLQEFTVFVRDGNTSYCSFKSGDSAYYGRYDTS